jgi:iron complex transport system ATP-binding protein
MTALLAREITVGYDRHAVIEDLTLAIPSGRCVALLGRNGAGKSTLLRTLAGIQRPMRGRVEHEGRDLATLSPAARGRRVAYLPQQVSPEIPFTVEEVVLMGRYPHSGLSMFAGERDHRIVRGVLERTRLAAFAHKRCTELSGGEFQRVLVASMLAQEARVMLLDEPTASLDLEHRTSIMTTIAGGGGGSTVVVATHDINLAAAHCSWVVALGGGGEVSTGPTREVLDEELVRDIFGVPVRTVEVELAGGATRRQFVVVS